MNINTLNKYIKCRYCGKIFNIIEKHEACNSNNYDEANGIINCYSCEQKNKKYTNSQLQKMEKARCKDCVANNIFRRFAKFEHLYKPIDNYNILDINKQLHEYVSLIDIEKVEHLLKNNANPNYIRQKTFCNNDEWVYLYNKNGREIAEDNIYQPITPLKLCVFRISDCLLTEIDRNNIIKIAEILIKYGANDKKECVQYYISRYGEISNEDNDNVDFIKLYKVLL